MSYQLVEDLQKKATPPVAVSQSCKALGVSRSGFYAHQAALRQRLNAPTVCAASAHLKAAFAAGQKAYGSRRLKTAMAARGMAIGRHRVRSLMKLNDLRLTWKRKFVHTTDSKHTLAVSPNVLSRQFEQALPNQAWVCDITYICTRSGWLYLAAVLNLDSRKVVGWAMSPAMPAAFVCTALHMAIMQRNPATGLIVQHVFVLKDKGIPAQAQKRQKGAQGEPVTGQAAVCAQPGGLGDVAVPAAVGAAARRQQYPQGEFFADELG